MANPFSFIAKYPLVSHALLSALYTAILLYPCGPFATALGVALYWYGRETGQLYHDLMAARLQLPLENRLSPIRMLWLSHILDLDWYRWLQCLVPAAVSALVCWGSTYV